MATQVHKNCIKYMQSFSNRLKPNQVGTYLSKQLKSTYILSKLLKTKIFFFINGSPNEYLQYFLVAIVVIRFNYLTISHMLQPFQLQDNKYNKTTFFSV
jgi:hypothetical protein